MNAGLLMNIHRISKLSSNIKAIAVQKCSLKLFYVPRRSFSILEELCWRRELAKASHATMKREVIDQNPELVQVTQTINKTTNFKDLIALLNQYSESVAQSKKDTQIDQILPFYISLFIEKSQELADQKNHKDSSNQFESSQSSSSSQQCQAILSELLVNNLSSCSVEWLLLLLEQSVQPNNEIDLKMLKVYEYLVARTPFLLRMTEIQISRFLQAITLVQATSNKKSSLNVLSTFEQQKQQLYWYSEMLEKVEFVIVERQLKGFSLKDLASLAFIYTTNNKGCESLFRLIQYQFVQLLSDMQAPEGEKQKHNEHQPTAEDISFETQQQQIMIYWSLSQQAFLGRIIEERQVQMLLKNQHQFPPNYQILLLSAYNSQKQHFGGVFSQILKAILPIKP